MSHIIYTQSTHDTRGHKCVRCIAEHSIHRREGASRRCGAQTEAREKPCRSGGGSSGHRDIQQHSIAGQSRTSFTGIRAAFVPASWPSHPRTRPSSQRRQRDPTTTAARTNEQELLAQYRYRYSTSLNVIQAAETASQSIPCSARDALPAACRLLCLRRQGRLPWGRATHERRCQRIRSQRTHSL